MNLTRLLSAFLLLLPVYGASRWKTISPEQAGFDPVKLEALKRDAAARRTNGLLIIRRNAIVCEWYGNGFHAQRPHGTASMAKAIVGGLSLLLARDAGLISPDDLASQYIPEWRSDPLKSKITIRHLATHTSGLEDAEQEGLPHEKLPGWKGAFWKRDPDPFSISLRSAPVLFAPGSQYAYSNPGMAALSFAVTASLRGTATPDIPSLLRDRVLRRIGVPDEEWSVGYGQAYKLDGLDLYANWGGGGFTPRATAAIGALMLHRGEWNGQQLIARKRVEEALADAKLPFDTGAGSNNAPASGLAWWVNTNGGWAGVPRDAFGGGGAGHQLLMVVPSLDLIVVRNGQPLNPEGHSAGFWRKAVEHLLRPVVEAITDRGPYRPSPAISAVEFAPAESVKVDAIDSDNWPITWGDDGRQYTSYGDGWGFEPRIERKLSLGIAAIDGTPEHFRGVNIRSSTAERTGEGVKGLKASGMLMVDRVLYMWVRNAGNAQLAWSKDRGKTWEWGFRFETSFGSPSFLNFGPNYRGARDEYVYTYSQDGPSAYESDDHLVLARAPKQRLRDRAAWEFLERIDGDGRPAWTSDLARRGSAFRYPGNCQRVDAVYHPFLKRYLLALGYGHSGGWGLFDAPDPWGPWTTAFHTEDWGLGKTHGYRLPAKWIDAKSGTMALVFSGIAPYDAFCIRRMTLKLRSPR